MRFGDLCAWASENGTTCETMPRALDQSGFLDDVDEHVQRAVDGRLTELGLDGWVEADIHYEPEVDWYYPHVYGSVRASEVLDPEFIRAITMTLGTHHHFRDLGRRKLRVKVREPIHDLDIEVRMGDSRPTPVWKDELVEDFIVNDSLRAAVRQYFDDLADRLGEIAIEEHHKRLDPYMAENDLWFDHAGNVCEEGETDYFPVCKGQLRLFKVAA